MSESDTHCARVDAGPAPGGGRSRRPTRKTFPIVIVLGLAAAFTVFALHGFRIPGASAAPGGASAGSGSTFSVVQTSHPVPPVSTSVVTARVDPGLVNIDAGNRSTGLGGEATGMVLTPSGVVLTNNHVIAGATSIKVQIGGTGPMHDAKVLGYDVADDVAAGVVNGGEDEPRGLRPLGLGEVLRLAQDCFGHLEPSAIPVEDVRPEPPQMEERRMRTDSNPIGRLLEHDRLEPARAVADGRDAILVSRFDFRGLLAWEPDPPAPAPQAPPSPAER